jgi:anti-anti-sigma factor
MGLRATIDDVAVLMCDGDLNAQAMVRFKSQVSHLLKHRRLCVVLDLERTKHVDLAGLGILVERLKAVRAAHGDLKVCNVRPQVYETFRLVGVSKLIESYPSREEAARSFQIA